MWERFTDNAQAVIQNAFRKEPNATEGDVVLALATTQRSRSLAARVLEMAGVEADRIPPGQIQFDRPTLAARSNDEARRCGVNYVGTEHILLSIARHPESHLARLGVSAERIEALISDVVAESRRTRRPLTRRFGTWCRIGWDRLRGRTS